MEEYQKKYLEKYKSRLQDLNDHLPDWIRRLQEAFIKSSYKNNRKTE